MRRSRAYRAPYVWPDQASFAKTLRLPNVDTIDRTAFVLALPMGLHVVGALWKNGRIADYSQKVRSLTRISMTVLNRILLYAASAMLIIAFGHSAVAAGKSPKSKKEELGIDLSSELPRVPAKDVTEALDSFELRDGFRIELVAGEPLVNDPVAIDFDENGRMYVVELQPYNLYATPGVKTSGIVRVLDDIDGDGRYDKSTIFIEGLAYPTAVACFDGGVFIGAAPDILFCKDTDGDSRADVRKTIFTGFGSDKAGEAHLNSFRWGADNRFHVSTNLAGGDVRAVADEKAKPVSVRGRGFIFDPRTLTFELTSGAGQHGMSMDDWGRRFVCSNSEPAQTLMFDGRYLVRNPYLPAPSPAVPIFPQRKFTHLFRISPPEPWRVVRTRLRKEGLVGGSDEGGKAFGFFTGATGVTIYRGDAWPNEYRGNLIVGDVANNIVFRANLAADGVGLLASRADEGAEFLASRDTWFRPVQFANAPDGTLYMLDMYRELIEGAAFLPPDILKHLDPSSGITRGRIYRIVPEDFQRREPPKLGSASTVDLAKLLEHANGWHRDTASRLLYERQDAAAAGALRRIASNGSLPVSRMHALHTLNGLGLLDASTVLGALDDSSSGVREHALRLSEKFAETSPPIRKKMVEMLGDTEVRVRYQLAFSLGSLTGADRSDALSKLVVRDGTDSWFRLAVQSSLNAGAGDVFARLAADADARNSPHVRAFLTALATQIGAAGRDEEVAAVLKSIAELADADAKLSRAVVRELVSKRSSAVKEQLASAAGAKAVFDGLLADAHKRVNDEDQSVKARVAAVGVVSLARFEDVAELLESLLAPRQPAPVQLAAIEGLAHFDSGAVATILIDAWPGMSPQSRSRAAETLLSRSVWISALLDAVEEKRVSRSDIDPARIKLLRSHSNAAIRIRVGTVFTENRLSPRRDVVAAYQLVLKSPGDLASGKAHFKRVCSACHRLEEVGTAVGADLKAIRQRGLQAVLLNILDPNREVKPSFVTYVLVTTEGRIVTGMIVAENANSITVRRADATSETVLRVDIEELRSTGVSFMPEGLEKQLDVAAMADLLAYLNSIK